jgi:FkbM family methyltransferase
MIKLLKLERGISIKLPNHLIANSVFRAMAVNDWEEWRPFVDLAKGCSSLIDLSASGGFFSALFAATRNANSRILSVEFDRATLPILKETRSLNLKPNMQWIIDERGVSDRRALLRVVSSGYGAAVSDKWSQADACRAAQLNRMTAQEYEAEVDLLSSMCMTYTFRPDLVKIDVEGHEYEVILSSADILINYKPRIHLELHLDLLKRRGKNPGDILDVIAAAGYRSVNAKVPISNIYKIQSGTIRIGLTAD